MTDPAIHFSRIYGKTWLILTGCLEVLSSLPFESEFAPSSLLSNGDGRGRTADRISQFIDLSFSRSLGLGSSFLFPDSRCDSRSLLTWRPGSNQSSIKLISHSGRVRETQAEGGMNGLITNLIRGRYFPLSKPNDAAAAAFGRATSHSS